MWLKFKENHWNVINTQDGGCPWRQGVGERQRNGIKEGQEGAPKV